MIPLGVAQAQGRGDSSQYCGRRVRGSSLFQANVVVDTDIREHGDFLAPKTGDPSVRQRGKADLLGAHPGPSRLQELTKLGTHGHQASIHDSSTTWVVLPDPRSMRIWSTPRGGGTVEA